MLFVTRDFFLWFLPVSLLAFHAALAVGMRSLLVPMLLVASAVFYCWGELEHTPVLVGSVLFNYAIGRALSGAHLSDGHRKAVLVAAIVVDLALLGVFKYAGFILSNLPLVGVTPPAVEIALPVGISFYTFTQIAFLVDLYGKGLQQRDLAGYGLFASYFPDIVAGPIIHWREVMPQFAQLRRGETFSFGSAGYASMLVEGAFMFSIGLLKKLLIADQLAVFADLGYGDVASLHFVDAWLVSLAYTFQIYFDFSGYADMAIGVSLLFGVRLPLNFNSPYKAVSIQDFWRRWHMTLSRWLRDYLYIPMGGSRVPTAKIYRNLFVTFLLGGLWHGAAWTFVAWGALHGLACCCQRAWSSAGHRMPNWAGIVVTFLFVNLSWVYFRAPDFAAANRLLATMAHPHPGFTIRILQVWPLLIVGALLVWCCPNSQSLAAGTLGRRVGVAGGLAGAAILVAMVATNISRPSPFIYYSF